MNKIPPNPILQFNPNQMEEIRKLYNYMDLNRLRQDLNIFQDWIKMQEHFLVKDYEEPYLERYLINSKGSIERAKKLFDKMCTLRGLMPQYLQGYDIENEFQNMLKVSYFCLLPKPTPEHYRVIYFEVHNPDAAQLFNHHHLGRYLLLILQYLICHDYNTGIEIVLDTKKITLGIMSKLDPMVISNTLTILTEGLGLRLGGIHLISGSKSIDVLITIFKQALSKKLSSRLYVHNNVDSLFKIIPKEILPINIGGDLDSEKIVEKNFKEFSSPAFIKNVKFMESAATDEAKRLCTTFNEQYSGMPGSFKVLTVD